MSNKENFPGWYLMIKEEDFHYFPLTERMLSPYFCETRWLWMAVVSTRSEEMLMNTKHMSLQAENLNICVRFLDGWKSSNPETTYES